jgi:hypothetical protein
MKNNGSGFPGWAGRWALVACLGLGAACSSFNRDWKQAVAHPTAAPGMAGPWEGSWRSDVNGHHGRLRCLMREESPELYQAWFHANFFKIFSYSYTVTLHVQAAHGVARFEGEANLGNLAGGVYTYDGQASSTLLSANYHSRTDHGMFELQRPSPP